MIALLYVICAVLTVVRVLGAMAAKRKNVSQDTVLKFGGPEEAALFIVLACVFGVLWPIALLGLALWWLWRKGLGAGIRWLVWKSIDRYIVPKQILRRMNGGT